MAKDENEFDDEYFVTELQKLHPEDGDVYILNIDTDDPELLYSDEVIDNVDHLSDLLYEITGKHIPIIVFGNHMHIKTMGKAQLTDLRDTLNDYIDILDKEENGKEDTENLTEQFN